MNDLYSKYARWRDAEPIGYSAGDPAADDAADAAFGALFSAAVPEVRVPAAFAAETMQVVATVAERDAIRARRTRRALAGGSLVTAAVALYFGAGPALSILSSLFVATLDLLVATVVWFVSSGQGGTDVWSLFGSMGRAAGAFISDPTVTIVLLALQGIAIAAFVALQRLLGSDPEYFK